MTQQLAGEQRDVAAFLASSSAHGADVAVQVIETHISIIFLAGERALKMKKAVEVLLNCPYCRAVTHAVHINHFTGTVFSV